MSKILFVIILALCTVSFAEEAESQNQPANVVQSDFDLADVNREDADDPLDVQAAVERYLEENPECADQPERICEVKILRSSTEKCGKGFKLADSGGWRLNATSFKARQYERGLAQGGSKPPNQKGHRVYGFGVCHKF